MPESNLQPGKECRIGKLFVVLAKFLLAGLQVIKELPSTDRPCDASPSCPEILHPAQGTTVQQNPGLGYCCKGRSSYIQAVAETEARKVLS